MLQLDLLDVNLPTFPQFCHNVITALIRSNQSYLFKNKNDTKMLGNNMYVCDIFTCCVVIYPVLYFS